MISLQDFYNQYNGVKNVGNTPENIGQCVGLSSLWMDNFGIPHVYGNADDLYDNAPDEYFVKIPNTADAICQDGDIIVWGYNYNSSYGHTGVAKGNHDVNTFECFEQNDPLGSTPHIKKYNYAYVVGWLRIKAFVTPPVVVPVLPEPNPGYAPTFSGQTVEKDGFIYRSYRKDGILLWTKEVSTPEVPVPVTTSSGTTDVPITIPSSEGTSSANTTTTTTVPVPVAKPTPLPQPTLPPLPLGQRIVMKKRNIFSALSRVWRFFFGK